MKEPRAHPATTSHPWRSDERSRHRVKKHLEGRSFEEVLISDRLCSHRGARYDAVEVAVGFRHATTFDANKWDDVRASGAWRRLMKNVWNKRARGREVRASPRVHCSPTDLVSRVSLYRRGDGFCSQAVHRKLLSINILCIVDTGSPSSRLDGCRRNFRRGFGNCSYQNELRRCLLDFGIGDRTRSSCACTVRSQLPTSLDSALPPPDVTSLLAASVTQN